MTDVKEKIAWIWWKMRRFVSVFMFVCVCCETERKKEKNRIVHSFISSMTIQQYTRFVIKPDSVNVGIMLKLSLICRYIMYSVCVD